MKKTRDQRSAETSQWQKTASVSGEKKTPGNRGRPRKTVPGASDAFRNGATDENGAQKLPETKSSGRLSTAVCRLCHGKFSPRSLRHAFDRRSRDSFTGEECDDQSPLLFHTDFQRLVGVELNRDPRLSEFVCKKCDAKFYKCQSILIRFLQRVNLPAAGKENHKSRKSTKRPESSANHGSLMSPAFTSDSKCLHSLVSWAHRHGGACGSCPGLQEVLMGQCWGSVKAVWACVDGHRYIMDTQCTASAPPPGAAVNLRGGASVGGDGVMSEEEEVEQQQEEEEEEEEQCGLTGSSTSVTGQTQRSTVDEWTSNTAGVEDTSLAEIHPEDRTAESDLSDRVVSEDEFEENRRGRGLSDDELFEPRVDKRRVNVPNKRRRTTKTSEEPKIKKKPGPKPGWKNPFKGEELPNIYKCPYQGCTAVYRAPDGLKKHIKEHHEEVRERPCPHPGCNKVFMIDRYLQRHVKLIHTEERNYICDQCGQTFKQRKHLSVHQMRHSGVKPLQCEVCGFQCRQRASLKYHMTKHKAEADLEFACPMCGKRFEKAHNLNVHMSMVHPVIQTEAQRGRRQQPPPPPYSDLRTITITGEVVQHQHDR